MKRLQLAGIAVLTSLLLAVPARADTPRLVGLGAGIGLAAPFGKGVQTVEGLQKLSPNFDWGFYVDIPLAYGFHLTPHASLYNINNKLTATDIGLSFKFIVEIPKFRPYLGVQVGDTNIVSKQQLNVGGLVGLDVNLVANLDAFVEVSYRTVLRDSIEGGNVATLHALAGLLLRFGGPPS